MPKEYTAIRDRLVSGGKSLADAKTEAAKIWNSRHPEDPNPWNREKATFDPKKARLKKLFGK